MPEEKEKDISKEKATSRIDRLDKLFATARRADEEFLKQAVEDERFYMGDQWDSADRQKLQEEEKPALTYNHIFPLVNLINGYYRQNKNDVKAFPLRGGSRQVAEILTAIIKHTSQMNNGDWEKSFAHLMGLITGKSYLVLNIDYDEDMVRGNLYYEYASYCDIVVDPFGDKYDLTDRDFFFKSIWMPKEKIERLYPGKTEDGFEVNGNDRMPLSGVETFNYKDAAEYQDQSDEEIENFRYRVKEAWWKEYKRNKFLVNVKTGKVHNVTDQNKQTIKRIIEINPDFRQIERVKPEMHMSQYVGTTELSHVVSPMGGMKNFPIVPFFPYFMRGGVQSVVTQLKDAQREHNKRMSQALHHLNASNNSGYTADADAVDDWAELEANLSKSGYIKKIKAGKRFDKDHPTELSNGHFALANAGAAAMKVISGVNSDLLGHDQAETISGVAIARRQAQGLMTTEIVHDNMKLTERILGRRITEAVQKSGAYSQEEVLRLVLDGNETEFEINKKVAETEKVLNDLSVGTYDVTLSTVINTPTARMANFMTLMEAVKNGMPIPPEIIVELSDWPDKEKILKSLQEAKAAQAAAAQAGMEEKAKDRQLEIDKIVEKIKGDLLVEAQKKHLDLVGGGDKSKNGKTGKTSKNN